MPLREDTVWIQIADASIAGMQCSEQISSLHGLYVSLGIPQSVYSISLTACVSVFVCVYICRYTCANVGSFAHVHLELSANGNSRTGYTSE